MLTRRQFVSHTLLSAFFANAASTSFASTAGGTPWRNWSGALTSMPKSRFSPESESALADFFRSAPGKVRPVGSGHSFSPVVPTDGHLVIIDQLSGIHSHDEAELTARVGAGTRLGDLGSPLEAIGQAMSNLPDIDRQTVAGAISTATHGTGIRFPCLSGYVSALNLVTPRGEILALDADNEPERFAAAVVSVGALGVITEVTFQNEVPYRLKQKDWVDTTDNLLAQFDQLVDEHRHFEIFPLTHSDYSLALATDLTSEPINNPTPPPDEAAAFDMAMAAWMKVPPGLRRPLINALAEQVGPSERVDTSYRILTNVRNNRFNEMEYSVPLHNGADCLREVLDTIDKKSIDVVFPLEYRYVARDDSMLSMSSGDEDHAAISIHRIATEDYRPYFNEIEPIFWKYGGRPHWGKIHSLGAAELKKLYPRFEEFQAIRQQLDPDGVMLNEHLAKLFID